MTKNKKNTKKLKDANFSFCTKSQKREMEIFAFCVINFEPIISKTCQALKNGRQNLSFVKDEHKYGEKMARNGNLTVI